MIGIKKTQEIMNEV